MCQYHKSIISQILYPISCSARWILFKFVEADSLFIKQMCRMLALSDEKSFHLLGYWLGGFLGAEAPLGIASVSKKVSKEVSQDFHQKV